MTVPITPLRPEECRPAPDAGLGALETGRGNLPLESLDVAAHITGLVAGVEVVQGFRNPFDVSLEATYVFPLPPRAAVTAFRMEADDRVIEGVLKERGQARADYDRAMAEGRRAAIAEEDRPDVFTIRVGNIVPGEHVKVRLSLSQPLPYEDGAAEFRFPLVVAPRYIPGAPLGGPPAGAGVVPDTDAVPDASRITPPVLLPGFPDPVRLSLTATIDGAGLDLREIRSSLHEVSQEGDTISLRPGERLDRDFILRLPFEASASLALAPDENPAGSGGEGTFTLSVIPPSDTVAASAARDVVLLLDRSGSMTGWKMVAARRAAARIVDTLTTRDRFAVLSFDSVIEHAFPDGLVGATDRNRYRAVEHLARLDARGGTEILAPMEEALRLLSESAEGGPTTASGDRASAGRDGEPAGPGEAAADGARDRVLVLVTDGQVGNEDQILERTAARISGIRVHTVGIDQAVNAGFLGRLALLGSGRCELVESEDRLDEAMEHIHRRIGSPLVTDIAVKPEGLDIIAETVTHVGSLYPGVPLSVSGRYRGAPSGAVAVRGLTSDGKPWETGVTGQVVQDTAARSLWARAYLRRLEDRYLSGDRSLEQRIIDTSLTFGVLCRFTAFVAVDTRVVAEGGPEHRVIQPVEMPSGWDAPVAAAPLMASGAPMAKMAAFSTTESIAWTADEARRLPESRAFPPPSGAYTDPAVAGAPREAVPPVVPRSPGGRGFSVSARMPQPRGRAPETDLDGVRPLLSEELVRLRSAESLPERDRRRYLADLASRLKVIDQMVGGQPDLAALAAELETAERASANLDALWHRAVDVLTAITTGSGSAGPESTPPGSHGSAAQGPEQQGTRRRDFWKRG
ncbi:inter-alpha-trypsin inhibitor domain-containing protein [Planotetraspora silvatica]|uniref:Inter-alpha-trypsin inhibitor domain-containing protein n=1 Tax=Planotetraspora silvatica TaxID=234614 RepID=A0A8J3XPF1_9ACTN|nr:VIT domain-containing protein [Planotetraspora silvatica]GII43878.1 inter-alpha-trypsin inhibitor domain-containing protein [Planotetraspora silvatica]